MAGKVNDDGGYDFELVSESSAGEEVKCSICMFLLRDPIELSCLHSFCQSCWLKWQKSQEEQDQQLLCPLCNTVHIKDKYNTAGTIERLVRTSLDVHCKHKDHGCQWTGKISHFEQHRDSLCLYTELECKYLGCRKQVLRREMKVHHKNCHHRLVNCEWCQKQFKMSALKGHYDQCFSYPVTCPNEKCQEVFARHDADKLQKHLDEICSFEKVECDFKTVGCKEKACRIDLEAHDDSKSKFHLNLVLKELETVRKDKENLQTEIKSVQAELISKEEKIEAFNKLLCTQTKAFICEISQLKAEIKGIKKVDGITVDETSPKIEEYEDNVIEDENLPSLLKTILKFGSIGNFFNFGNKMLIGIDFKQFNICSNDFIVRFSSTITSFKKEFESFYTKFHSEESCFQTANLYSYLYLFDGYKDDPATSRFQDNVDNVSIINLNNLNESISATPLLSFRNFNEEDYVYKKNGGQIMFFMIKMKDGG